MRHACKFPFVVANRCRILMPLLLLACHAPEATVPRSVTNATVTVQVHRQEGLERPAVVCLFAAKPSLPPLQNGTAVAGAIDGRREFPAGTRSTQVIAYYAALLAQHGWTSGRDFVAAENSLHFYGIAQLGGGCSDSQLQVNGATDRGDVPFANTVPASR